MMWFTKSRQQEPAVSSAAIASDGDRRAVFLDWHDSFFWTTFIITGSPDAAERAVVNASELAEHAHPVFQDWLVRWARATTARASIAEVSGMISAEATKYEKVRCTHANHQPLTLDQIDSLRRVPVEDVCEELDSFARSVLVLHGIHQNSTVSCALLLSQSRERVCAAYCCALQWLANRPC